MDIPKVLMFNFEKLEAWRELMNLRISFTSDARLPARGAIRTGEPDAKGGCFSFLQFGRGKFAIFARGLCQVTESPAGSLFEVISQSTSPSVKDSIK